MRSAMTRFAAATVVISLAFVIAAWAAVPSGNLLEDPGAEQGGYGEWTTENGFVIEQYGAENRPSSAVGASIGGGANVFAGGSEAEVSRARQSVDVASSAAEIDAGGVSATLTAHLGGVDDEEDFAEVTADFLAGDGTVRGSLKIGPVTAAERNNQTALLQRSATAEVPAGTRSIRVTITATRRFGIYTDGYADNLSLVLSGGGPAPAPSSPGRVVAVEVTGGRVEGRLNAEAPCKGGRKVVITKGTKVLGKTRSTSKGSFSIKTRKHKKGKLVVKVRSKKTATVNCSPVAKRIPGRN